MRTRHPLQRKLAEDFVAGLTFERLRDDRLFFYAVTRALEIISEAARRLPAELRERHPELPWRAIMGVGNVYRHNYDTVAEEYVWRTVHEQETARPIDNDVKAIIAELLQ